MTMGISSLWMPFVRSNRSSLFKNTSLSSLPDAFGEDLNVQEHRSPRICVKFANPPHSTSIYWAHITHHHILILPQICKVGIPSPICIWISLFLVTEEAAAQIWSWPHWGPIKSHAINFCSTDLCHPQGIVTVSTNCFLLFCKTQGASC